MENRMPPKIRIWWQYLPLDERGVLVLDADSAVRTALLHSVPFLTQVETLFLSRSRRKHRAILSWQSVFAGFSSSYTADGRLRRGGGGGESFGGFDGGVFSGARGIAFERQFTTGAELIVGIANSLTWDWRGAISQSASTIVDFNLLVPLLRGAVAI